MRWEGVGAISGGGATSKLLMDYDPAVVSDILDFLFLPNYGLDLDILKVNVLKSRRASSIAHASKHICRLADAVGVA